MNTYNAHVASVSPAMARAWLEHNKKNRNVSASLVNRYAQVMKAGGWEVNGEAIIFDTNGNLIDGQHRLHAIVKADVEVDTVVVLGVEPDSIYTIDTGRMRRASDLLHMEGFKDSLSLAAAVKIIMQYLDGQLVPSQHHKRYIENQAVLDFAQKHERRLAVSAQAWGSNMTESALMPRSLGLAAHFIMARKDEEMADEFFDLLRDSNGLPEDHPVRAAYDRLFRRALTHTGQRRSDEGKFETLAILFRAWSLWRQGKQSKQIRVRKDKLPRLV